MAQAERLKTPERPSDAAPQLLREEAALRRIATFVAQGRPVGVVLEAVVVEAGRLFSPTRIQVARYGPDGHATIIAGTEEGSFATEEPAEDVGHAVRAPIVVDGATWGVVVAVSPTSTLLSSESEARIAEFAELVATAISNTDARAQLIASRERIVAAGDEARRRIERNLHDGTQQRLLALGLDLQRIRATIPDGQLETHSELAQAERDLESVLEEVRELSRGLHPALLSRGGLRVALTALARRSPIPVNITIDLATRPPPSIETAVYYLVSEALTNAIKHSQASAISIGIAAESLDPSASGDNRGRRGLSLRAVIADDGIGGAESSEGSGLMGAVDRVDALGGRFTLDSRPGRGTTISIELPVARPEEP